MDKDAGRETREGLGQHGVLGPVVPRGEQRAGRPGTQVVDLSGPRRGHGSVFVRVCTLRKCAKSTILS